MIIAAHDGTKIDANDSKGALNARHMAAFDAALDACQKILREELYDSVSAYGKKFSSKVIIHGKLAQVVEALGKIQKGQRLAMGLDSGEDTESLVKLDNILAELSAVMSKKPCNREQDDA